MSSLVVKLPDVRYVWNPKTSRNRMINSLHERKSRRYLNIILLPKLWVEPEKKIMASFLRNTMMVCHYEINSKARRILLHCFE